MNAHVASADSTEHVLTPLDVSFLRMESRTAHLHIGALAVFEGPPPNFHDLRALIAQRWAAVPRATQRVHEATFRLRRPDWIEDEQFDPYNHIFRRAVPTPGGLAELQDLVGAFMSLPLDLHQPPWEVWVVEGLTDERWAVVTKVHHSMVDGIGGTDLLMRMFDEAQALAITEESERSTDHVGFIARGERLVRGLSSLRPSLTPARSAFEIARLVVPRTGSTLAGSIGKDRVWEGTKVTFEDLRLVRDAFGGSVNDVCLAIIARGFRDLLMHRGIDPSRHRVRTLVPVSIRVENYDGAFGNEVTAMVAELPVDISDPIERLVSVRTQLDRLKASGEAASAELGLGLLNSVPPPLFDAVARLLFRLPQRIFATVTTNVPGPHEELHLAGHRMLEMYPYVPIAFQLRTGVAMLSYNAVMHFGFTADRDTTPDLDVLVHGVDEGLRELLKEAHDRLSDG